MKTKFFIDRLYGCAIFIEVEDGIIQHIWNDEKMSPEMNRRFKGKSINIIKTDFLPKMGKFHALHADDYFCLQHRKLYLDREFYNTKTFLDNVIKEKKPEDVIKGFKQRIEMLEKEKHTLEVEMCATKKILKEVHQYEV